MPWIPSKNQSKYGFDVIHSLKVLITTSLLQHNPKDTDTYVYLAVFYSNASQFDNACRTLLTALEKVDTKKDDIIKCAFDMGTKQFLDLAPLSALFLAGIDMNVATARDNLIKGTFAFPLCQIHLTIAPASSITRLICYCIFITITTLILLLLL